LPVERKEKKRKKTKEERCKNNQNKIKNSRYTTRKLNKTKQNKFFRNKGHHTEKLKSVQINEKDNRMIENSMLMQGKQESVRWRGQEEQDNKC